MLADSRAGAEHRDGAAGTRGRGVPNKKRVAQAAIATAPSEEPHRVLAAVRARLHELKVAELQAPSASAAPDAAVHIPVAPSEGKTGDGKGGEGKPTTNKGLSYFSRQVAEHMAVMKKTTYLDLADKLVLKAKRAAAAEPPSAATGKPDKAEKAAEDDEKNIRRRVYDAVNVLRAIGAIHSERKDILWVGLPSRQPAQQEAQWNERRTKMAQLDAKQAYLTELLSQQQALQGLVARNQERAHNGCDAKSPSESRIALPFMVAVVPSCPSVSVEVKISDAQDYAHFDFAGSPYQIHDDTFVLSRLGLTQPADMVTGQDTKARRRTS